MTALQKIAGDPRLSRGFTFSTLTQQTATLMTKVLHNIKAEALGPLTQAVATLVSSWIAKQNGPVKQEDALKFMAAVLDTFDEKFSRD